MKIRGQGSGFARQKSRYPEGGEARAKAYIGVGQGKNTSGLTRRASIGR